jgi:hypothetical protein
VRADLTAQLLLLAVQNPDAIFKGRPSTLPGVVDRPPISEARTLRSYQDEWLAQLERTLYEPFEDTPPLLEKNKYCFLCHLQTDASAPGELPALQQTKIPKRWLERGGFAHRAHDMLACPTCHEAALKSEATRDINLPKKELCLRCHVDGAPQSAGTDCMLCHLYHDTSQHPEVRAARLKDVPIGTLTDR